MCCLDRVEGSHLFKNKRFFFQCPNDNFICHPASGCVCREGFKGDQCDVAIYSPVSDKSQLGEPIVPVDHGGLIAGLIVSILLIVIVIAALFYYRRRISHLKSELAHVQYIADPSSAPGTSPLAQVAPLFSDSAPFLEGKVWSLAVVGRSESKKRETLFFSVSYYGQIVIISTIQCTAILRAELRHPLSAAVWTTLASATTLAAPATRATWPIWNGRNWEPAL